MLLKQISDTLQAELSDDAKIDVAFLDNGHLKISICAPIFSELSKVKQQQKVYRIIQPWITDGTVHAVHLDLSS